jgi:NADP-dependent 3-hydroxy acid dehydrogenase YdfG
MNKTVLIIGAGSGYSAFVARLFAAKCMKIGLASRNTQKLNALANEIGARNYRCDATGPEAVSDLFNKLDTDIGIPDLLIYNPNVMLRGSISEIDPARTKTVIMVSAYGAFLAAQQA